MFCRYWAMTPEEVERMPLDQYEAFVRHMDRERRARERAERRRNGR